MKKTNMENQKTLIEQLEKQGEIEFNQDGTTVTIWETDQGEDNVRGEDCMNYMYNLYDTKEFNADGEDAEEYDGGLCTGTPKEAMEMAVGSVDVDLKEGGDDTEVNQKDWDELAKKARKSQKPTQDMNQG